MKSRTKEQGSALHIVIIVVLVLAVLSLLGFVFWQNFVNKPAATSETTNTTSTSKDSTSTADTNKKILSVSEWGIQGTYNSDQSFSYEVFPSDPNALLLKKGSELACGKGIGAVYKFKSDEKTTFFGTTSEERTAKEVYASGDVSYQAFIGDNYYFLKDASTACSSDNVTDTDRAALIQASKDFVSSIESIN